MDNFQEIQIRAAEEYLYARRNMLPATIIFVYKSTYNYIFRKELK